ncbi:CMRF35-like molecule 7 [Orycteropus afer afer]|uniref:CMRF35-like molecule 7 n=1 Tax=Orycteropus afer afer TaxID=1230840 RepID=A0A8B7BEA5_ORYAF|nr:CMRF35-like molecule 7 [Orycteropus afer afer]
MWLLTAVLLVSVPGCFSIEGPQCVSGPEQGSVTVKCFYDARWETYNKWWCQGKTWDFCRILIQSTGSEQEVKKDRLTIRDNHTNHFFTVTMEKLRRNDNDTYWCGIEKRGPDLGFQVKVIVSPAPATPNLSSVPLATRTYYLLLAFVKLPILLILFGALLWMKGPWRVPEEHWGQPDYSVLSLHPLTKNTAP